MNVIKLTFYLFLVSIVSFSQTNKIDAYYILNDNHKDYILKTNKISKIKGVKNYTNISTFKFYDRKLYEERQEKIKKDKKEGEFKGYIYYDQLIETMVFSKAYNNKISYINHCDTHFLNLVDYDWLIQNSWKENNPNILFKDLYFLLRIEKDKYLKFKVVRTVIAR
ncbi:hypothetical protein V1T75_13260 [Tenacibaculum sp. FZY0031]|uniref:hypothetical protein n=1 Tax=Tenacibaculum sp. FZY0031 TaxID=3116648 RepID=UPI002EC947CF|nr:hypothetical protein [Tenacibaculum sp. FZY0031]